MRVYDLLEKVGRRELAKTILKQHSSQFNDKDKCYMDNLNHILEMLNIFYKDIENIKIGYESEEERKEYEDFKILCREVYDDNDINGKSIYDIEDKEHFDFDSLKIDDFDTYFIVDGVHLNEVCEKKSVLDLDYEHFKNGNDVFITLWGVELMPRRIFLDLDIVDKSIELYGEMVVAAEVFWEMTYFGLLDEDVQEKADDLNAEVEEIQKMNNGEIDTSDLKKTKIEWVEDEDAEDFEIDDDNDDGITRIVVNPNDYSFSNKISNFVSTYDWDKEREFLKSLID